MSNKLENKINNIFFAINNATLLLDSFLNNREEISSVLLPCVTEKNSALDILINSNLINNHSINEFFGSKYSKIVFITMVQRLNHIYFSSVSNEKKHTIIP